METRSNEHQVRGGRSARGIVRSASIQLKSKLESVLGKPKLLDEVSFVVGMCSILSIQGFLLVTPEHMGLVYTLLAVPLITARYFLYRRQKEHFFLLDFCYYAQLLLLLLLWHYGPYAHRPLFVLVYALCSGPLAGGIYMWNNALVLHDIDRFTSTFIHLVPPVTCYALRWHYPPSAAALVEALPSLPQIMVPGLVAYFFWQLNYLLKTEVLDRKRFKEDDALITSLRWMTRHRPHAIYLWCRETRGWNVPALAIIVVVQAIYTVLALAPVYFFYRHKWLNQLWLVFLFLVAAWNGSRFYFEIMAERERRLKEKQEAGAQQPREKLLRISSSKSRFFGAILFIVFVLFTNKLLLEYVVIPNWFNL